MPVDTLLVTIAIPTLNRSGFLRLSVQSALAQTHSNIEILVVDNASDDETATVLATFEDERLRVVRQVSRVSMFANWNLALQSARGDYFLLLSDDDLLEPLAVESMVLRFKSEPAVGLVCCRGAIIDSDGQELMLGKSAALQLTADEMIAGFFRSELDLWPCSLMFRRSDLSEYLERFALGADAAVWIDLVTKYGVAAFVPQVLTRYRVHANATARTPLSKWYSENLQLSEYAIEKLQGYGHGNADLYKQIRRDVRRLNIRITAGFVAASWRTSKRSALGLVKRHADQFASAYGILVLIKSVVAVSVPRTLRFQMVALSRMVQQKCLLFGDRAENG
jgi:glycosyltransferase involved in cell wall biosynthesis